MQALSADGVKRGRLPNLGRFYREQAAQLKAPTDPVNYCRLNDPDWFKRIQQVVLDLRNGVNRQYSGVSPTLVAMADVNIAQIAKLPIGNQFEVEPQSRRGFPALHIKGIRRDRAVELSQALLDVTIRDPYLARHGVIGYLYGVDKRMQVLITDHLYASYGRVLIDIVDQVVERLDQPWLSWNLVGFEVDGVKADLTTWLTELGLDTKTDVFHEKAKAPHNQAELDHIRIDVCLARGENRQSREFYEVMLLAAVTELWKCVAP